MRVTGIRTALAALLLSCALPGSAGAQAAAPPDRLLGTPSIRISGGFIAGDQFAQFSAVTVHGFIATAGVAFPIARREDMELQVDVSYLDYSGGNHNPGGGQSISGRIVGPTVNYVYNFVRPGRRAVPFVGGGGNLVYIDQTEIRASFNPFSTATFQRRMTGLAFGLQAVGGVQFASQSRVPFRVEGRFILGPTGLLFAGLGGISF